MVLRNVAKTFSLEEQRQEINEIAIDLDAVNTTLTNWNAANWDTAYSWGDHAQAGYLTSYTETDPVFGASAASGIAAGDITNWNSAYGWGDHSTEGYLVNGTLSATIYRGSGEFRIIAGGSQTTRPHIHLKNSTTTDLDILGASSAAGGVTIDSRGTGTVKLKDGGTTRLETSDTGVTITGDISVSGNVDGRDLATDGTKLDGIETGATADQTDAEIKTAYENNADTNAFTDAEQTKLAGIAAGAEVNLDPGGTFGGAGTTADPAIGSIQFKNTGNTFGGDSTFVYNNTENKLGIGVAAPQNELHILRGVDGGDVSLRITNQSSVDAGTTASMYLGTSPSDTFNTFYIRTLRDGGVTHFGYSDPDAANHSPNIILPSTGGFEFGTQTDTAASGSTKTSATLDHYEEGTWTPVYEGGGTFSCTYAQQAGYFTRIGRVVYVHGVISTATVSGTGSGPLKVAGLPFTVNNGRQPLSIRTISWSGGTFDQTPQYATFEDGNDHFEILKGDVSGSTDYVASSMLAANNQNILHFSGFYTV